ncbi:MAG: metal ABC transporter substrate-binding protein [Ilumatobacteraceae bacterium]
MRTILNSRGALFVALALSSGIALSGCSNPSSSDHPTVVVSYSVLGDVVSQLVGDAADVRVIIPNGVDPHEFEPSAKNVEAINNATLIVVNGANLEEHLIRIFEQASQSGVPLFEMVDHLTTRSRTVDGTETIDPHLWLDPMAIYQAIPDLAGELGARLNIDLASRASQVQQDLADLNSDVAAIISSIRNCTLITGHDEMGYFAARYGCTVIGAIIPGLSTSAEATAGQIANLKQSASAAGVDAIFVDAGASAQVAGQLARELDVELVVLSTHMLESGDHYREFILRISNLIATALN